MDTELLAMSQTTLNGFIDDKTSLDKQILMIVGFISQLAVKWNPKIHHINAIYGIKRYT